jgi:hypothetical protein
MSDLMTAAKPRTVNEEVAELSPVAIAALAQHDWERCRYLRSHLEFVRNDNVPLRLRAAEAAGTISAIRQIDVLAGVEDA